MLVLAGHARAQSVPPAAAEAAGVAAVTAGIVLLGSGDNAITSATGTAATVAAGGPNEPFGHPGTAGNGGPLTPGGAAGAAASGTSTSGGFEASFVAVVGTVISGVISTSSSTSSSTTATSGTSP